MSDLSAACGAIAHALGAALGMAWDVGWSLVLGFVLSAIVQAVVSKGEMQAVLGRDGPREIALATLFGAASSSCSYAAAAMSKTLFKGGAGFIASLAFLFASTNLVVELGVVLWLLLGWQFAAAEWLGGVVLVVVMSLLVRLTARRSFIEAARTHVDAAAGGHEHGSMEGDGATVWARLSARSTWMAVAQNFAMDVSMLWKDLVAGFVIAGALAAFVPDGVWHTFFLAGAPQWLRLPADALIGPLVAVLTFVCAIGNVPMAAVLWASGVSFGGVLAFIYADLIVLPLLDVYRRYYGLRMAAYIGAIFYVTMAIAAIVVDRVFAASGLVPVSRGIAALPAAHVGLDATTVLNVAAIAVAVLLFVVDARHPMQHHHHHDHAEHTAHA